jgi:hypothetical protein
MRFSLVKLLFSPTDIKIDIKQLGITSGKVPGEFNMGWNGEQEKIDGRWR